jgi:hypothetical protein
VATQEALSLTSLCTRTASNLIFAWSISINALWYGMRKSKISYSLQTSNYTIHLRLSRWGILRLRFSWMWLHCFHLQSRKSCKYQIHTNFGTYQLTSPFRSDNWIYRGYPRSFQANTAITFYSSLWLLPYKTFSVHLTLFEKLTVVQLVTFFELRRFITTFTKHATVPYPEAGEYSP